jgi:hypothetical protein
LEKISHLIDTAKPLVSAGLIGLIIGAAVWVSLRTGEENRSKQKKFA